MTRSPGWRLPALLVTLFLIGVFTPATAAAQQWSPDGRIVGQVTHNGQPLANYRVDAFNAVSYQHHATATTDGDGRYTLPLDPSYTYKLNFGSQDRQHTQWAHNQSSYWTAQVFSVAAGQDTVVDEAFAPTGTLVVRVTDEVTGAAVSRFRAEAEGPSFDGDYTDTGVITMPYLLPGEYRIVVWPADHFEASGTATVTANGITEVTVAARPTARLETTMVDAATGAPVENACITAVSELDVVGFIGFCSRADGRISYGGLETGTYRVFVKARDGQHGAQWVGFEGGVGSRYLAKPFEVRAGETTTMPPIQLDLAGTITGRVTDAATGAPVAEMCAYPYATSTDSGPGSGPHCSDQNGTYTISGLGPYHWPVEFVGNWSNQQYAWHWSGGRPNQLVARPTEVTTGQATTLDTALVPGATLRGRVLDADGNPVFGVVFVRNALTGDPAAAYGLTDENGYYEVRALSGQFVRVKFEAAYPDDRSFWYDGASGFHDAQPVWVPAGGTTTGIDFTVPNA